MIRNINHRHHKHWKSLVGLNHTCVKRFDKIGCCANVYGGWPQVNSWFAYKTLWKSQQVFGKQGMVDW